MKYGFIILLGICLYLGGCGGRNSSSTEMKFTERYRDSLVQNFPDIDFRITEPLFVQASRTDGNPQVLRVDLHRIFWDIRSLPKTGELIRRDIRANRAMYERLRGELPEPPADLFTP